MLSAVILTKNEKSSIAKCIKDLSFCNEVLVIDDNSTDDTVEITRKSGAKVFQRSVDGNFSKQRNFGLQKANGDWVLFIDADERISPALAKEIQNAIKATKVVGYFFNRNDKFLGKQLNYGETSAVKLLRLAKKDAGKWSGSVHEVWQISGKTDYLKCPLLHKRDLSISNFLQRINYYSTLRAKELYQKGTKTSIFLIVLYPKAKFFYNYFYRLGFLDGVAGFIFAILMSLHSFMVRSKLWVMWKNKGKENYVIDSWQKYV